MENIYIFFKDNGTEEILKAIDMSIAIELANAAGMKYYHVTRFYPNLDESIEAVIADFKDKTHR